MEAKLDRNKVVVAMDGDVDSSVTAFILKRIGYDVVGATMYLYDELGEDGLPRPQREIGRARQVAERLGIPHHVADFRPVFDWVVRRQIERNPPVAQTANPCMECNRQIKFGKLLEYAMDLGAYYLATGHYASLQYDEASDRHRVFCAQSEEKDQAYFLQGLSQRQLSHLLLPLGAVASKEQVWEAALEIGMEFNKEKDSEGICFSSDTDGGRKTLGTCAMPAWGLLVKKPNFIPFETLLWPIKVGVRLRKKDPLLQAEIIPARENSVRVVFEKVRQIPESAQWAVFYKDGEVLGGGMIETAERGLEL